MRKPLRKCTTSSTPFRASLKLCMLTDAPIYIATISMGLPIWYFKGSHIEVFKLWCFSPQKVVLIVANGADPDEMQHYAAFHLCLHCLSDYPFVFRGHV